MPSSSPISHRIKDVTLSREIGGEATFKQLLKVAGQTRPVYPPTYRGSSHPIAPVTQDNSIILMLDT